VVLRKPFHAIAPVAIFVLVADPGNLKLKVFAALLVSLMILLNL
jgi:hypothetical protein